MIEPGKRRVQNGAVFLVLLLLMTAVLTAGLLGLYNTDRLKIRKETDVQVSLADVKNALIGYAVASNRPGSLPCPDFNYDGLARNPDDHNASNCRTSSGANIRPGWVPWKDLGIKEPVDKNGNQFWYATAGDYNVLRTSPLNSDTEGVLQVDGIGDIVAVVIAPGDNLAGQNRVQPFNNANTVRGRFLEGENNDGDDVYSQGQTSSDTLNDRMVFITRAELMSAVERRVAGEMAAVMRSYADASNCGTFPVPAPFRDPSTASLYDSDTGSAPGGSGSPGNSGGRGQSGTRGNSGSTGRPASPGNSGSTGRPASPGNSGSAGPPSSPGNSGSSGPPSPSSTSEGMVPVDNASPANWGFGCAASVTLPAWFRPNNWHHVTYYAIAPASCTPGNDCLEVIDGSGTTNDKQGVFLTAGTDISGNRPSASPADYYEGENATPNDTLFASRPTAGNDHLRVILP